MPQNPQAVTNPLWSEFSALITGIAARYATREDAASFVKEAMEGLEPWYLAEEAAEDRDLGGGATPRDARRAPEAALVRLLPLHGRQAGFSPALARAPG